MRIMKILAAAALLMSFTGCADNAGSEVSGTAAVTSAETVTAKLKAAAEADITAVSETVPEESSETGPAETSRSEGSPETPEDSAEESYETFYGVLIDEDCSDFEDPPMHDLPCMFMKECRASGYGLDIQQEDGSWVFYMFDENGQDLSWEYLNVTQRQDGLFVNVSGTPEDNIIKVISIEES